MLKGALPPILLALFLVGLISVRLVPLAVAGGLYVAHGLLKAWPSWPHELWSEPNGTEWVLWCLAAGAGVALLEHFRILGGAVATTFAAIVGGGSVWFLLMKQAARWPWSDVLLHVAGGGFVVALLVVAMRRSLQAAPPGRAPAIVITALLSLDAALLASTGSGLQGQLCGVTAAALGAAIGTTIWNRPFTLTGADGTWIAMAHALFVLAGVHLSSLPWSAAGCALLAPGALYLLGPGATRTPRTWAVAACLLLVAPLGGAFWFAVGS